MARADAPYPVTEGHFESFDGTPIAYQLVGAEDAPPLLLANGAGARLVGFRFIIERYAPHFRFVCWDYRGLYDSGRPLSGYAGLSVGAHARDGVALIDHLGFDRFHAFGWSMGVQVLLEMQRVAANRFLSLVMHNGVAGHPYRTLLGTARLEPLMPDLLKRFQRFDGAIKWAVARAVDQPVLIPALVRLGLAHHDLDREVFHELAGNFKHLDIHVYLELLARLGEHDASDVLERVRCPALMIASSRDKLTPMEASRMIVDRIPDARLEVVPGGSHYAAVELPAVINRHLDRFYREVGAIDPLPT